MILLFLVFITTYRNSLEDEELKLQEELKRQSTLLFHTYFLCPDFPKYHFIDMTFGCNFEGNYTTLLSFSIGLVPTTYADW